MPKLKKFKKKKTTQTTIADEVAAIHGLTKSTVRPLTKSVFTAMVKQFFETGYLNIAGFATLNLEITIRSGKPRTFIRFTPGKLFKGKRDAVLTELEGLDFLNYLLERDDKKAENIELRRLDMIQFIQKMRNLRIEHDQDRMAAAIEAKTGQKVDPRSIGEEYLIPPRDRTHPLPDHRVEVHEIIATAGVFPLEKLFRHVNPESDSPPVELPDGNDLS